MRWTSSIRNCSLPHPLGRGIRFNHGGGTCWYSVTMGEDERQPELEGVASCIKRSHRGHMWAGHVGAPKTYVQTRRTAATPSAEALYPARLGPGSRRPCRTATPAGAAHTCRLNPWVKRLLPQIACTCHSKEGLLTTGAPLRLPTRGGSTRAGCGARHKRRPTASQCYSERVRFRNF